MAIIFKYVHVPRKDGTLRRAPYIPIFVNNKEGKLIRLVALIDSGADYSIVPKDLAIFLGLKEHDVGEGKTSGIGGDVNVRGSTLRFAVKGDRENYPLEVPVLILQDENLDVPLLLGRNGFFEEFEITFKQNEEKIYLKKINPNKIY